MEPAILRGFLPPEDDSILCGVRVSFSLGRRKEGGGSETFSPRGEKGAALIELHASPCRPSGEAPPPRRGRRKAADAGAVAVVLTGGTHIIIYFLFYEIYTVFFTP